MACGVARRVLLRARALTEHVGPTPPPADRRLLLRLLPRLTKLDQTDVTEADFKDAHAEEGPGMEALLRLARQAEAADAPLPLARDWAAAQAGHPHPTRLRHESISAGSLRGAGALPQGGGHGSARGGDAASPGKDAAVAGGHVLPAVLLLLRELHEDGLDKVAAAVKELKAARPQGGRGRAGSGYAL